MSFNPLDIYARAARRLKLTPGERAALKTVDTLLVASLAGALLAVAQAALSGGAPLSFHTLAQIGEYAFVTALLTGLVKLFRASGDSAFVAMGNAIEGVASRLPQSQQPAPVTQPYSPRPSGGVPSGPPGPLATARQERLAALSGAGYRNGGGATTQPAQAVSAATSTPAPPVSAQTAVEPSPPSAATPAPSQPQSQPEGDDNGPPTMQMPAVTAMAQAVKADGWTR